MKSVSVIIPNYNGQELLNQHLDAVIEMVNDSDQVIIVDDCSTDNSIKFLKEKFGLLLTHTQEKDYQIFKKELILKNKSIEVSLIKNLVNLRFAAACNRGVTFAKNELVFLLNTDVKPHATILEFLIPHFNDEKVFAVGCLEEERTTGKIVIGGKNELHFERGMFIHNRASEMTSGNTAWVSGGSGLFDKGKWKVLKGFDVAYSPAYWEDVDLSFRARERGWKVLFESQAKVDHNHESTNSSAFGQLKMNKMSWTNANYFTIKNGTWLQKIQYLLWQPYWKWKMKSIQ